MSTFATLPTPGTLLFLLALGVLLFGNRKMPELAHTLGKSWNEFKDALNGIEKDVDRAVLRQPEPVSKQFHVPERLSHPAADASPNGEAGPPTAMG